MVYGGRDDIKTSVIPFRRTGRSVNNRESQLTYIPRVMNGQSNIY